MRALKGRGLTQLPGHRAIIDAIRTGLGLAVLPAWMASAYLEDGQLASRRLSSDWMRMLVGAGMDAARGLVAELVSCAPRLPAVGDYSFEPSQ